MSSRRMAWKPPPFLGLLLLICFHATLSTAEFQLTDEILHFVPECSRECFLSFLDVNYENNPCDRGTTSLQCLCAARGASGFTIGEGLVQCIAAEKAIDFCSDDEATDEVFVRAFGMCNGKPSAIPATNSVFTATLILPSSGPGVVSFPPLTTTRTDFDDNITTAPTTTSSSTTSSETLEIDTSDPPQVTRTDASSGFTTSVRTSTSDDPSTTTSPVPDIPSGNDDSDSDADADGADDDDDDDASSLGTAQVVGISVGVAAAAGLAAVAILIARYYRRQRHLPDLRSLFSKRDTWPYPEKGDGGGGGNPDGSGSMAGVARQIERPLDSDGPGSGSGPPAYEGGAGWYSPATIGVAVASPGNQQNRRGNLTPANRPLSRLLPAKPVYMPGGLRRESPSPSEIFRDATMVTPPVRRRDGSPLGLATQTSQGRRSPPLTLADTIQTRQQPSPIPTGATLLQQQSPRRFSPPRSTSSRTSPQPRLPPPTYASPRSLTTANTNKPQPPIPFSSNNKLHAPPSLPLERDSAVTEFEEDGGLSSRSTGVSTNNVGKPRAGSGVGGGSTGQVWVPPVAHPMSGLSYYFADQNGNWVLRESEGGQQHQQQQQQQQHQRQTDQSHIHPALRTAGTLAPAAEISRSRDHSYYSAYHHNQNQQQQPQQWSRSSSIYSPNMPRPLFSGPRRSSLNNNSGSANRRSSGDSGVTQFSAASSSGDIEPPPPPGNLSPVAESPPEVAVPRGIYPGTTFAGSAANRAGNGAEGPDKRNPNNLRLAAGPPRSARPYHPPGQPSPTLGLMIPQPSTTQGRAPPPSRPYNSTAASAAAASQQQQQQPSTLRAVSPSPPPDRDLLPSATSQHQNDIISPLSPVNASFSSLSNKNIHNNNTTTTGPWRPPRLAQHPNPPSPTSSANTATSSLLSKRLGPVRAADMSFPAVRSPSTQKRWHQPATTAANGYLSPETPGQGQGGGPPVTPTWVPRLTPTRRGDDLFLNVQ